MNFDFNQFRISDPIPHVQIPFNILVEFRSDIDYPYFPTNFDFQEFFLATVRENIAQKITKIKEEVHNDSL